MIAIQTNAVKEPSLIFPGGEVHVRLTGNATPSVTIEAHLHNSNDIMELFMVTDALRRLPGGHRSYIRLICPYLPYARQDRVCNPGEAMSLGVMCDLINAQKYDTVEVWDVHSDVALGMLDRVHHVEAHEFVSKIDTSNMVLVAPDAGAVKRVAKCAAVTGRPMIQAHKSRDTLTGKIKSVTLAGDPYPMGADFLMVDDICDGGRTFIELAKTLKRGSVGKGYLYVTHGIMSKGLNALRPFIDGVFVANPFPSCRGLISPGQTFCTVLDRPQTTYTKDGRIV